MSEFKNILNNRKIYYRTIMFPIVRILFYIIAVVALFGITAIGMLISIHLYGDYQSALTNLIVLFAIIIFLYLLGFGKQEYGAAQYAVFTEAIINNEVPKKEVKFGRDWVHSRFSTYAPLQLFIKCIKAVSDRIRKKDTKFSFFVELRALLILFIVEMIPFLSSWCICWAYMHPQEDILKCCIDATEFLIKEWKETFPPMIKSIIGDLIKTLFFTLIAGVLLYEGVLNSDWIANFVSTFGKYKQAGDAMEVINNCVFIATIIYSYIILIFINPFGTINILRKFISIANGSEKEVVAFNKYTQVKQKLKSKFKK